MLRTWSNAIGLSCALLGFVACSGGGGDGETDGASGSDSGATDSDSPSSGGSATATGTGGQDDTGDGSDDGTTDGGSNCEEPGLDFVAVADSDIAGFDLPNIYVEPEVDTSDWTVYDATCQDGSGCTAADGAVAFPTEWGCEPLVGDDATDNSAALACLWWGGQPQGSDASSLDDTIFFLPDGTYNFGTALNGVAVFRPDILSDHRGLRGQSRDGTILQTTHVDDASVGQVNFFETEFEADVPGDAGAANYNYTMTERVPWSGGAGAARGATTIELGDTSGFVDGGWIELRADSTPEQTVTAQLFRARIVAGSVSASSLQIDRPLPDDFTGGNATAIGWRPTEELVFEHLTLRMKYPDHQEGNLNWLLNFNHTAESHVVDVSLHGYQVAAYITESARIRYAQNELQLNFDKPFNTYGIALAAATHLTFFDSYFFNTPEGIACGGAAQEIYFGFNHFAQPQPNGDYDSDCTEGDGNDCVLYLDGHDTGATAHGTTVGPGHLHCSNQENDVLGLQGSASCHGTRSQDTSGSFLLPQRLVQQLDARSQLLRVGRLGRLVGRSRPPQLLFRQRVPRTAGAGLCRPTTRRTGQRWRLQLQERRRQCGLRPRLPLQPNADQQLDQCPRRRFQQRLRRRHAGRDDRLQRVPRALRLRRRKQPRRIHRRRLRRPSHR